VPADVLGEPKEWKPLLPSEMKPSGGGTWDRNGKTYRGTTAKGEDWATLQLGDETYGDCVVRATLKTTPGSCGQIRFGKRCQVMVVANGAFVFDDGACVASEPSQGVGDRTSIDFVMRRRAGKVELWLDGVRALQAPLSLGVAGAGCSVENVRLRRR
jgi:hypothetical protein